jgi:DNA-binding LytR/AlgR family response regulator
MRVLIVEDEWIEANYLARAVRLSGHTVIGPFAAVGDALDGIGDIPEFAFLDVVLRGRPDGLMLSKTLWYLWRVPSVLVTARNIELARSDAFGRIFKPFSEQLITETLAYFEARLQGRKPLPLPVGLELPRQPRKQTGTGG